MNKTFKVLAATTLSITLSSNLYTYKKIDGLKKENESLLVQLNNKDNQINEASIKIEQLKNDQIILNDKLTNKEKEVKELNQVIENKNISINDLKQQLEKAKKVDHPRSQVSRGISDKPIKTMNMELTFYTNHPSENGTYGGKVLTKTGYDLTNTIEYYGYGIAASDPNVLPLYSVIEIEGIGKYIILDTGNAIKSNKLDILVGSKEEAYKLGRYTSNVKILRIGKGE